MEDTPEQSSPSKYHILFISQAALAKTQYSISELWSRYDTLHFILPGYQFSSTNTQYPNGW